MSNEATGTEIVPHKVKLKEVLKGSEGELIVLQDFEQTKETLVEVARKYENLVITKENLKEGKEARAEIREFRFGVQNITKHNKDLLNKAKNEMEDTMGGLIELIKPTEDKLDAQIKEIENAVKIEKERKEQEERERIANLNKRLSEYRVNFEKVVEFGRTDEDEQKFNDIFNELQTAKDNDEFQEFGFDADNILDEYAAKLPTLKARIEQIKEDARKEEELKKEREEFEAKKREEEKAKAEEEEKLKAEKEAFEKEKREFEKRKQKEAEAKQKEDEERQQKVRELESKVNFRIQELIDLGLNYDGDTTYKAEGFFVDLIDIKTYTDEKWSSLTNHIKEVKAKAKAEADAKAEAEAKAKTDAEDKETFKTLVEEAKSIGADISEIEVDFEVVPSKLDLAIVQEKIELKKSQLSVEKIEELKAIGVAHIEAIAPHHKAIFDYFGTCKIAPEHENHIVTFEDELRASFKKLKNSIS